MARAMAERWPDADVIGSDLSHEMLDAAAATPSRVRWEIADIRTWAPAAPVDVLYSNAALHWVDRHDEVFPRLVAALAPGGLLAIQMPLSWGEPSHRAMRDTLARGGAGGGPLGDDALRARYSRRPVHDASWYYDLLAPLTTDLDIWETRYLQVLDGDDAVFEWVKGTALRPILEALDGNDLDRFVERYKAALNAAYPQRPNGTTLYPFPRLFLVART